MDEILKVMEALCIEGVAFNEAIEQVGLADAPAEMTATLLQYWDLCAKEHAHNSARAYYDKLMEERT